MTVHSRHLLASPTLLFAMLMGGGQGGHAQFSQAVQEIAHQAASMKIADALRNAELEDVKSANILTNPEAEFEYLLSPGDEPNRWGITVSQGFAWPGTYKVRRDIIRQQQEANRLARREDHINLHLKISEELIGLIGARRQERLLEQMVQALARLDSAYGKAYAQGEATILDVNKIKIQTARMEAQRRQAQIAVEQATANVQAIIPEQELPEQVSELIDFPACEMLTKEEYQRLLDNSPETLSGEAAQKLLKAKRDLNRMEGLFPGFTLSYKHLYEDYSHYNGFGLGLDLPIYTRKHHLHKTKYLNEATDLEADFGAAEAQRRMEVDFLQACQLREQISKMGPVVENVNNLALLRRALEGGEMTLLSYLQEVNYFLEAQQEYENLRQQYATTMASLNRYVPDLEDI